MAMTADNHPAALPTEIAIVSNPAVADPAPLGLAAFALTTFLLSADNAGWTHGTAAWLGYAFAYGGFTQLLAGMWEFRNRNVFGATAFSTYGAFWLGLALYVQVVNPGLKATAAQTANDLAWILLAFAIFTGYMMLWSLFVNTAVFSVFLVLEVTFIVLCVGQFQASTDLIKLGGYLGVVTAALAWYASAAGIINGMTGRSRLWVGKPVGQSAH
jgi:succinate-acetate transporter protein